MSHDESIDILQMWIWWNTFSHQTIIISDKTKINATDRHVKKKTENKTPRNIVALVKLVRLI